MVSLEAAATACITHVTRSRVLQLAPFWHSELYDKEKDKEKDKDKDKEKTT
jgi:hypothetical protein